MSILDKGLSLSDLRELGIGIDGHIRSCIKPQYVWYFIKGRDTYRREVDRIGVSIRGLDRNLISLWEIVYSDLPCVCLEMDMLVLPLHINYPEKVVSYIIRWRLSKGV